MIHSWHIATLNISWQITTRIRLWHRTFHKFWTFPSDPTRIVGRITRPECANKSGQHKYYTTRAYLQNPEQPNPQHSGHCPRVHLTHGLIRLASPSDPLVHPTRWFTRQADPPDPRVHQTSWFTRGSDEMNPWVWWIRGSIRPSSSSDPWTTLVQPCYASHRVSELVSDNRLLTEHRHERVPPLPRARPRLFLGSIIDMSSRSSSGAFAFFMEEPIEWNGFTRHHSAV